MRLVAPPTRPCLVALIGLLCAAFHAPQAAAEATAPKGLDRSLSGVERKQMPGVDHEALLAEDAAREAQGMPLRFATPIAVRYAPETDGTWEATADGTLVWRLLVGTESAYNLNFGFTRYRMPRGGRLYVYSPDGSSVLGPFTEADNETHGQLWTPVLPGREAIIEVDLPPEKRASLDLELTSVNHGYEAFPPKADKSGACNVDVVCPEADAWRDPVRSVARLVIGGGGLCTGALVNNVRGDATPYVLTAFHCEIDAGNAPSVVAYWNFETSVCGGTPDGSLSQFQTGSFFRAGRFQSDFTLLELDDSPSQSFNVHFAGWNRSGADPTSALTIHHPQGDEKRISFEVDPPTTTSHLQDVSPGDGTHLRVADWDLGTTEPGSSGAPLFDPAGRIVGQLHGGAAACGNDLPDWFGRLSASWDAGGSASTRLRDWLDPDGTGAVTLDGMDRDEPPPANDAWQDATPFVGGSIVGSLVAATNDGSASEGNPGQPDVWYAHTASTSGTVRINTCGTHDVTGLDTVISVHAGGPGTTANEIAVNDDWPVGSDPTACQGLDTSPQRDSAITLNLGAGQTVLIRVSRYSASTDGQFLLTVTPPPPANDAWQDAIAVPFRSTTPGVLAGATNDGSASEGNPGQPDVWYMFNALEDRAVAIDTCGTHDTTGLDTVLSVHSGGPGTTANELAVNDDWPFGSNPSACRDSDTSPERDSAVALDLSAGQSVLIRVSRYGPGGSEEFVLTVPEPGEIESWLAVLATLFAVGFQHERRVSGARRAPGTRSR